MTEPTPGLPTRPGLPSRLIQLVARFRPDADGVGETALRLADALLQRHGLTSDFLVYNPPRPEPALEIPPGFPHSIERLGSNAGAAFDQAVNRLQASSQQAPVLLLHYASYGYSRHGVAFWLPSALRRFSANGGRVVTLFHELYAGGRFPSKVFFTSELQQWIFRRTLAASDAAFTSSEDFLEAIRRSNSARRPVGLIGICSSAGEPEEPRPLRERSRRLAVFGRFATRKQLYELHLRELEQLARHLGIEEIADIGAVDDARWMEENVLRPLGPLVRSYGTVSVAEASRLLEDCVAGALAYRAKLTGKSSVFAAYQAHAMAIVLFPEAEQGSERSAEGWPLAAEELFAIPATSPQLAERLQVAASLGHAHYQRHRSVRAMAEIVLPALTGDGAQP
jgi:hypothetical protein